MIYGTADYREILKDELGRRSKTNPRYSLRAYARDLGTSAATLSEIFNGRQGLSMALAKKFASHIKLTAEEIEYFCDLVESEHGRSEMKRKFAKTRLRKYQSDDYHSLQLDTVAVISQWYHFAILELTHVEGFKASESWIARALGIEKSEVHQAVTRLKKLGLLEIKEDGSWIYTQLFLATTDGIHSRYIQDLHHQLLQKAQQALPEQTVAQRDCSAMIMAIDEAALPEAKKMLKEFRRKFCDDMNAFKKKNKVYCLSSAFFELTKNDFQAVERELAFKESL